jgi:diguanylate cyclase (GGDEF)-like protein/PAS domain S-box-containing protein
VAIPSRIIARELPDGTYIELVASLCGTRTPALIMTMMFLALGLLTVRVSHDNVLACLTIAGALASGVRLVVLIRGRRLIDGADMSLTAARRFERVFALTYWAFAAVFGLFAARILSIPLVQWQMPVGILVVGYAAGAASTIALRPRIVAISLVLAVIPPAAVLLFRDDASALVSSLILLALLVGGLRSVGQRYQTQSIKTTTGQAFARQARTDHLTGLGNRLALTQAFDEHARLERQDRIAFHYVDLDEFKPVNDNLGHHIGDFLLCAVAERLRIGTNPGDVVVRLGGDEFVIVQSVANSDHDVERENLRIEEFLNRPYTIDGLPIVVGASVGSRRCTYPGQSMGALLADADDALRQRKAERKARRSARAGTIERTLRSDAARHVESRIGSSQRETEARSRLLVEGVALATWEGAPDGLIEADSPSWRAYTGQSYDDWKGYGWLTAIHPDDRVATIRKWQDTVKDQRSVDAEYRLRGRDGTYRWMSVHAVPLRDADGNIVKWFGMNIDIHDRRQAGLVSEDARSIVAG